MVSEAVSGLPPGDLMVAAVQMNSGSDAVANVDSIRQSIRRASEMGAQLIVFPENCTHLAPVAERLAAAEPLDGRQVSEIREEACRAGVHVLLGSVSERSHSALHTWNTSVLIQKNGEIGAVYRKIHLFDVQVSADTSLQESASVLAGEWAPVVADVEGWRVGLSICYDVRFPELYRALAADGAHALMVPAAFTFRTGASHWELLLRARAVENQAWLVAPGQTGRHYGHRESWGHTMIVDPWGNVTAQRAEGMGIVLGNLESAALKDIRERLPSLRHRRDLTR